ncbi:MAG: twin transmembrane helix small protein [Brevundimonas sp.]|jgi:NADH:ubiquinone oxidoreductase subunit 6 (subunit J)|nr:MAG: twin transmembrane helix small protein [Brevundimonas sp.]
MDNVFNILILVAIAAVAVTLGFGIRSLYKDGPEARSRSNKLMRLRVALQAVAIALLCLGMWWKSTHGA